MLPHFASAPGCQPAVAGQAARSRETNQHGGRELVIDKNKQRLNLHLDRWQKRLPGWASRSLRWLRKPSSRWVRIPVGLLFVMAGLLGFLPVFGLWMLVPGLLLLSLDVPALRPLVRAAIVYTSRWLHRRRLRRRMRRR